MRIDFKTRATIALIACMAGISQAAPPLAEALWADVGAVVPRAAAAYWVNPPKFRAVTLDHAGMRGLLASAPHEDTMPGGPAPAVIALPMPDGTFARFHVMESPVMAPALQALFPDIRTYVGQGLDDIAATVRLDMTPAGFHAQVLAPSGAVYIDPHLRDASVYASYYKRDHVRADDFHCLVQSDGVLAAKPAGGGATLLSANGTQLRTYRLAVAATGEYTAYHGGTVTNGLAAVVTAVNRVSGIYETELAIRLQLVANNHLLIYTNSATDPYTNGSDSLLLSQNQSNLDAAIGDANYDIGHVFSTAGGGLASLGCVCATGVKARGETGTSSPIGDAYYVDYVAHEMGHQFGANHTFNSSAGSCSGGTRNDATAYEVGSGATIMAYAGICSSDNLQPNSDPYFHFASLDEIIAYTTTDDGDICPSVTPTTNAIPAVSAGADYTIPKGTPFILTASASDANGDTLTYCWEESDLGPSTTVGTTDNGSSPLFRSYPPVTGTTSRLFPRLTNILANTTSLVEILPTVRTQMTFRVTVRDNRAGGGGVHADTMKLAIATNAGPFAVTSFNGGGTFSGVVAVTWSVANTTNAPVNCAQVVITLSTNGGLDFPILLHPSAPNTGTANVVLPNFTTTNARLKVQGAGNVFFDICNASFAIVPGVATPAVVLESASLDAEDCSPTNGAIDPGEIVTVGFSLRNIGSGSASNVVATLLATNGVLLPSAAQGYGTITNGGKASRPFSFLADGLCGGAVTCVLHVVDGTNDFGTFTGRFDLGQRTTSTIIFSNSATLMIPNTNGPAVPYPSTIAVSNVAGAITKLTVKLDGVSHSWPTDLDILLVGPGGQNVMLVSDCGGGVTVTNVTWTFDDDALGSMPLLTYLGDGTYLPSNYGTSDPMNAPAPASPHGTTLAAFNGSDPNGLWRLYVMDDESVDSGSIARGWSLSIAVSNLSCCVEAPRPVITGFARGVTAGTVVYAATNGTPFATNYVLTATNLLLPFDQWLRIATNVFDASGNFIYTNAPGTNAPQRFFILTSP